MSAILFKKILIIIILLVPELVMSQKHNQKETDSLLFLLNKKPNDTTRINLLNKLSMAFYYTNTKKGVYFGSLALSLSKKISWKKGIANSYISIGSNQWTDYNFIVAQDYYYNALKIAVEINNKYLVGSSNHHIGVCYESQNKYILAIDYYKKSSKIYRELGLKTLEFGSYGNISDVLIKELKFKEALILFKSTIQEAEKSNEIKWVAWFYLQAGYVQSLMGNFSKAIEYNRKSLVIFENLEEYPFITLNISRFGDIYTKKKDYKNAVLAYKKALQVLLANPAKPFYNLKTKGDYYRQIGNSYLALAGNNAKNETKTKYLHLASIYLNKSISILKSIGDLERLELSLKSLSDLNLKKENFKSALQNYKEYILIRDSLFNSEKDKKYAQHQFEFEYNKKRDSLNYVEILQKKELENNKALINVKLRQVSLYAIIIIVMLFFIISYFVFNNRLQKIKFNNEFAKEKSETQIKEMAFQNKLNDITLASLKSQMNPHFIFICLNSIKYYTEKNENEAASMYITKFAKLIRSILDSARSEKVTLAEEINLIGLYLEMECMRLKEKLTYEFIIESTIDIDFIEIPPLIIQPYVENAIWHGLMPKSEGGYVKISFIATEDSKYLIIKITDNGIGRARSAEIKQKSNINHTSLGSKLNEERISIFNAKYKTETEVTFSDLTNEKNNPCGTIVTIKQKII
jgi:tetratricopeptide (TPR) repeat protein/ribosomal protein S13